MSLLKRISPWLALLSVLIATALMVRQERTYNQTTDEGSHLAAGMEWLSRGTYSYDLLHPPLARVVEALPLFLTGVRTVGLPEETHEGTALLNARHTYWHNLLLVRMGVAPFFWAANALIFFWMSRHFGRWQALLGVVLFSFCPPVLAHSALVTTDASLVATFLLAVVAFGHLLRAPSVSRGLLAGAAFGLALLCKFTAIPFFVVAAFFLLIWYVRSGKRLAPLLKPVALGCAVVAAMVWGAYRFSVGPIFQVDNMPPESVVKMARHPAWEQRLLLHQAVPAPEFLRGIGKTVSVGTEDKHLGYLMGRTYSGGRILFFPVDVLTKTPIAELLLAALGLCFVLGRTRRASYETAVLLSGVAAPLLIGMLSRLNLGVRHVLPIYPFVAMLGALGVCELLKSAERHRERLLSRFLPWVAGSLIAWQVVACIVAAPQFLPYLNEAAMPFFGWISVDSDVDWGQDYYRLEDRLRQTAPADVSVAVWGDPSIEKHGSERWKPLQAGVPVAGWVAISESQYRMYSADYAFLHQLPYERVGRSIRLYQVEP